jgi:hypothetical protein
MLAQDILKKQLSLPIKNFTSLDGLPSNETYYLIKDSKNYIWISSDKGVSRFNGYEFENFTTSDGLVDNTIFNIKEDKNGNIWFVGMNRKLCYWDGNQFIPFKHNDVIEKYVKNHERKNIEIIGLDIDLSNNVTIGFSKIGYIQIDETGNIIDSLNIEIIKDTLTALAGSYYLIHNIKNEFYSNYLVKENDSDEYLQNILIHEDSIVWVSKKIHRNINYLNKSKNINRVITPHLKSFHIDSNYLLLSYPDCKFECNMDSCVEDYSISVFNKLFFYNNTYLANENGIWLQSDGKKKKILDLSVFQLVSLIEINNQVWITSNNNGIYLINIDSKIKNLKVKDFNCVAITNDLDHINIYSEKLLDQNIRLNKDLTATSNQRATFNNPMHENYSFYSSIKYRAGNDNLSISNTWIQEEFQYYTQGSILFIYKENKLVKTLNIGSKIFSIIPFDEVILLGTNSGILQLSKDLELKKYALNSDVVNKARIQDLALQNDRLIIATRGDGIFLLTENNQLSSIEINGLTSSIINDIAVKNNTIWIGTNQGVSILESVENDLILKNNITIEDGLISSDVRQVLLNDSMAVLGCDNGISTIMYSKTTISNYDIPVYISSIKVNDTLNVYSKATHNIFDYNENNISFTFIGVHPELLGDIKYRYRLVGLGTGWYTTNSRTLQYNYLPPGKYTLVLQASNLYGNWTDEFTGFDFTIKKPYWKTSWFIALMSMLLVLFFSSILYIFLRIERKKNENIKALNEIKQQAINAQMNPHFISNSMNAIQNFILKNDKKEANKYLVKFSRLIRLTFENSKRTYISLNEEIKALQTYIELEQLRFDKSFEFSFSIDANIDPNKYMIPSLLIQPFLENAIWHGILHNESENGKIKVAIHLIDGLIHVRIIDNGIGIEASQANKLIKDKNDHKSSGLSLTKKRIELIHTIEKTSFQFKILDLNNEEGITTGTEISFTLPYIIKNED